MRNNEVLGGVLATRTVGNQTQLVGTLDNGNGQPVNIDCTGPLAARNTVSLSCR